MSDATHKGAFFWPSTLDYGYHGGLTYVGSTAVGSVGSGSPSSGSFFRLYPTSEKRLFPIHVNRLFPVT